MTSLIGKARRPKFELHLRIYDLNNVPLVSGASHVKWHLPHSIHGEHRGRTGKRDISNHRVEYDYEKVVPVRIGIDKTGNLTECYLELEVVQEFSGGSMKDEKSVLGNISINLSEYIEESEAIFRSLTGSNASIRSRRKSSVTSAISSGIAATTTGDGSTVAEEQEVQAGIIRRYLMQEAKINSTLKIGILMVQIEGERNFSAPPLKSAPAFGGIAGIVGSSEPVGSGQINPLQQESNRNSGDGHSVSAHSNKSRDTSEIQDMYRRALAASWACQPGELPADECIEDIFAGGQGWNGIGGAGRSNGSTSSDNGRPGAGSRSPQPRSHPRRSLEKQSQPKYRSAYQMGREDSGSTSADEDDYPGRRRRVDQERTLRPGQGYGLGHGHGHGQLQRFKRHDRNESDESARSSRTITSAALPHDDVFGDAHSGGGRPDPVFRGFSFADDGGHGRGAGGDSAGAGTRRGAGGRPGSRGTAKNIMMMGDESDGRTRSGSLTSLATTMGSDRPRHGYRSVREVDEFEVRDDLVAWKLPSSIS